MSMTDQHSVFAKPVDKNNLGLAKLTGQGAPYTIKGMAAVYFIRVLPVVCFLLLGSWLVAPQFFPSLREFVPDQNGLGLFAVYAVIVGPALETALFVLLVLLIPSVWYDSIRGQLILCFAVGVGFGLLHLPNLLTVVAAFWGGAIMFAALLQHWLCGARDRGMAMCFALHVVHNTLMLLLLVVLD